MPFEWSHDYCLTCDREAPNGAAYCSQACRLADMEQGSCSSSPKTTTSSSSANGAPGGFYLPPALNFSSMARSQETASGFRTNSSGWAPSSVRKGSATSANLHPSPSRTSLSSMPSQHSPFEQSYLSQKALQELNEYANAFDTVRDSKRRMTVV